MFISQREKENIKRDSVNLWNNIFILEKARQCLFIKDSHGTKRPKVDLLLDGFNTSEVNFWNALNGLQKRIEKLEK